MANNYFNDFGPSQDSFAPIEEGLYRSSATGDKVYLVRDGKKHWITSPEVLKELGYTLGSEAVLETLTQIDSGEPIRENNVIEYKTFSKALENDKSVDEADKEVLVIPPHEEKVVPHAVQSGLVSIILLEPNVEAIQKLRDKFMCEIITVSTTELRDKQYGDKIVESIEVALRIATGEYVLLFDHIND